MKSDGLEKVFSQTTMKRILGFKVMFLCYTDGKLNNSFQAETGKDTNKPQRLTKKQRNIQYDKKCSEDKKVNTRKEEMVLNKIANDIKMPCKAIVARLRFTSCWLTVAPTTLNSSSSSIAGTSIAPHWDNQDEKG